MVRTIYLSNKNGRKKLKVVHSNEESDKVIYNYMFHQNLIPSYYRYWYNEEGDIIVDFGRWDEFFILKDE